MPRRPRRPRRPVPMHGTKNINSRGGSRKWTGWTKEFCAANPVCWLAFPRCTIRATSIDHYYPRKTHPHLAEDRRFWRPACGYCNRARGATPVHLIPALRAKLEREFRPPPALGFFG